MTQTSNMTMVAAINRALHDAMAEDARVIVIGEDVGDPQEGGVMGATKGLSTQFGSDRVLSTPISEQVIIGSAVGAAIGGFRPVAEIMLMNFMTVAMDMLTNHAAKLRFMSGGQTSVPMVVRTMTGSGLSLGGQHSDYLEAWFAHTPGLKVVAPSNAADAYGLMRSAIDEDDPVIFIENIQTYSVKSDVAFDRVPIGKAKVVREGTDLTIVAHSLMVSYALAAAQELADAGISAEVIDLRTIAPWDRDTVLASVGRTGRALIVHEAVREFGIGAEIAAQIGEAYHGTLKAAVKRVGGAYCPVPFSKPLETGFVPSTADIVDTARTMMA